MAESYDFIQGRLRVDSEKLALIEELLTSLNESCRRAFAISIRNGVKPSEITREWVEVNNCLYSHAQGKDLNFTSIQRNSIARRAAACRNVANATAKVELDSIQERLPALRKKIQQDRDKLAAMKSQPTAFAKNKLAHKQEDLCRKKRQWLNNLHAKQARLESRAKFLQGQLHKGAASMVFGSKKLLRSRSSVGKPSAAFKNEEAWRLAWKSRDLQWLFEGDKHSVDANTHLGWNPERQVLIIRLTNSQADERLAQEAAARGVPLEEARTSKKLSFLRPQARFIEIPLTFRGKGQSRKLAAFEQALTPERYIKTAMGKLKPVYRTPVSWRIWVEKGKAYARALWSREEAEVSSWASNGCLGVDINFWGVSWAACSPEGNKPPQAGLAFFGERKIIWRGVSQGRSLHETRLAAKELVEEAARRGVPIALEHLDFRAKKAALKYVDKKRASALSGFAYSSLKTAIVARARKMGVEVRMVSPAWTSLMGWAKFGRLGLSVDQAAAFAIARRGALSKNGPREKHVVKTLISGEACELRIRPERMPTRLLAALKKSSTQEKNLISEAREGARAASQPELAIRSAGRRSTPGRTERLEPSLASALGRGRTQWPGRLRDLLRSKDPNPNSARGIATPPQLLGGESKVGGDDSPVEAVDLRLRRPK